MYINRTIEKIIKELSTQFKVILITGARQVGKSTLLQHCVGNNNYVPLDRPDIRELAINDPGLFLQRYKPSSNAPLIIDEIQYAPDLLPYIKSIVDSNDAKGQYFLTGSQQFHLMNKISESLAGRVGVVNLLGLSLNEIDNNANAEPFIPISNYIADRRKTAKTYTVSDIFKFIHNGFYPALNNGEVKDIEYFYSSYVQTYLERDIRDLASINDEMLFLKFIRIVAARTGQVLKYSELAGETGISEPTAKKWLSVLVTSGLVYLLEPYYANITKRMTKMPKIYFLDTGLCAYLTGWSSSVVLEKGAMAGAFFETFVVVEILKSYLYNGKRAPLYWYRDIDKKEIDILIEKDGLLYPVEIKLTAKPEKSMVKSFGIIKNRGEGAVVCSALEDLPLTENINVVPVSYI